MLSLAAPSPHVQERRTIPTQPRTDRGRKVEKCMNEHIKKTQGDNLVNPVTGQTMVMDPNVYELIAQRLPSEEVTDVSALTSA